MPLAVLAVPIIPTFIEIFRRKDKGPRDFPDQTLYEDRSDASKPIPPLEHMRAKARVKIPGEIIRVVGDVSIPNSVEIKQNIVVHGNLKLGSKCHIHGSIKASGEVEVGEESVIQGHIISEGRVTIRRNARVNGIVDSPEHIILEDNATVEAVFTKKSLRLAPGAKINRRISAGVSIIMAPQLIPTLTTEKPPLPAIEGTREIEEAERRTAPSFGLLFKERHEEVGDEKVRLFKSLQDRMRILEPSKAREIDETRLKELTPTEVEIYKLAISGVDVNEIGLRLFMDSVQVKAVINSLIKRGYLDERLKPITLERAEKVLEETTETSQQLEAHREEPELEELPMDEVFERLLASRLRIEVKKGLKGVEEEPATEAKGTDEKSATKIEKEEILKEWRRAASLLFGHEETEKENLSSDTSNLHQTGGDYGKLSDTAERGPREKEDESVAKSTRKKYLRGSLPLLTLLSILFLEVTYYNPALSIFSFLRSVVPPTVEISTFFLAIALALAVITSLYLAKNFSSLKKAGADR